MIKIFLQNRCISIVREVPKEAPAEGVLLVHSGSVPTTFQAYQSFKEHSSVQHLLLVHPNPIAHIEELRMHFKLVIAGGGIVQNSKGEVLMIFRKGKWDLPKGKLDGEETPEAGAVREVIEECSIPKPDTVRFFTRSYHTYEENGADILKETWWFRMSVPGIPTLKPQKKEGITEAIWIPVRELEKKLPDTYGSITELIRNWLSREGKE